MGIRELQVFALVKAILLQRQGSREISPRFYTPRAELRRANKRALRVSSGTFITPDCKGVKKVRAGNTGGYLRC